MQKVMLSAAVLAMVLATAVPAVAQVDTVITNVTASSTSATASASVASASASASAAPTVQYQYGAAAELPSTGGSSLIALGVGILLVAGGLLARKFVR